MDSMQVHREFKVLTARPDIKEQKKLNIIYMVFTIKIFLLVNG